jgi:hypothetical protein
MEKVSGTILGPNGEPIGIPTVSLDPADVHLLRKYKKLLHKLGLREALYCSACWNGHRNDGCEAHVTDHDVLIKCRCTMRVYIGSSF